MTATDAQVRMVMRERRQGRTQEQAAVRANLGDRHTVAKYEQLGQLPSELKTPRSYRTRADPFAEDWPALAAMLERAPELEATTLFEWLDEQHPGRYAEGQLRTLQRRIGLWRVEHTTRIVTLDQVHAPGEVLQTDGVWLRHLQVTIAGAPFPHVLIHSVLPYSNWEWGRVAQSESFVAVRRGLQSALLRLGHLPQIHQTDNTSAATHRLGVADRGQHAGERGFNNEYLALVRHFGIMPRTIHVGSPNEQGDVEAGNGAIQRAIHQQVLLYGSREFASIDAYEQWLFRLFERRNLRRQDRLAEELAAMRPLTVPPVPDERELRVRVSAAGLIRVLVRTYSVPSQLVGKLVMVRVGAWQIAVWYGGRCWAELPRLAQRQAHRVDDRHVIDTLLRKPGGFRHYRYRDDLFPTTTFRRAWETLTARLLERRADLAYPRILKLAAEQGETVVEAALTQALTEPTLWDDGTIGERVRPTLPAVPTIACGSVDLAVYDALLDRHEADHVAA